VRIIKLTPEGLQRVRLPSIPYDVIEIDRKKGIMFKHKGCVVSAVEGPVEGDVITITGLLGSIEVQT